MNWSSDWGKPFPIDGEIELHLTRDDNSKVTVTGHMVGDLAVHDNIEGWGYRVSHVPTMAKFDAAVPGQNNGLEELLRWCDTVQTKHGQLWAILRELTPDTYNDKSDRVMKAKDQIRAWCLSVEVK